MHKEFLKIDLEKLLKAYELYKLSFNKIIKIEKIIDVDLEVLDAFFIRFERVVELLLSKLSKSIEIYENGNSEGTLRDRLNLLEKIGIIKETDKWIDMRNLRNKIVHDYIENLAFDMIYIINEHYNTEIDNTIIAIKKYKTIL